MSMVQPLKAITEPRGWWRQARRDIREIGLHIALEYNFTADQGSDMATVYHVSHENFYENQRSVEQLDAMITKAEGLVPFLNELTSAPPRPFTITSNTQLRRLRHLTGNDNLQMGDESPIDLSNNHRPPSTAGDA